MNKIWSKLGLVILIIGLVSISVGGGCPFSSGDLGGPTTGSSGYPAPASRPNPYDGATNVPITATLSWRYAISAESYDVYFGTTMTPSLVATVTNTFYAPSTLSYYTNYYWRVDSRNTHGVITNTICSFRTEHAWTQVALGSGHNIARLSDGTLWAWGLNNYGQLGLGDYISRTIPTQIGTDTDWTVSTCSCDHAMTLKSNGTLWVWGRNHKGQLGLGDSGDGTERLVPTQVGTDTDWVAVASYEHRSSALKSNGTLWSWGDNYRGQLGLGDSGSGTERTIPTQVGTDTDWVSVEAGHAHGLAIKTNGTLWAWGYNFYGQLGLGDTISRTVPTQVDTDIDWASVSGGYMYTVARKTDGTLWSWGDNRHGQLGLGDSGSGTERTIPTQVGTDKDWVSVEAGSRHGLAIKTNGTLWSWGDNNYGQLGLGDSGVGTERIIPTQIGTNTNWTTVACGSNISAAIRSNRTIWTWGSNYHGQLGLGDSGAGTHRNVPTQVE